MEKACSLKQKSLKNSRLKIINDILCLCEDYSQIQNDVLQSKLAKWKEDQRKIGVGDENELKFIKRCCEGLAESILPLKQKFGQISTICDTEESTNLQTIQRRILTLLDTLVASTFIIVEQPPQVNSGVFYI